MEPYERAVAYLEKMDPAVAGAGGHDMTLRAACELFRFGLSAGDALAVLRSYNARCQPPWKDGELRHKLADAEKIVRASGKHGIRQGGVGPRRSRTFVPPPAPVRRPQPVVPVYLRSEADEEAWWQAVFDARGIVDPAQVGGPSMRPLMEATP
jgi:hypothetical protein